jgi:hypothetical protein
LKEMQSLTDEQRQSKASKAKETACKKEAFVLVKKDDGKGLTALLDGLDPSVRWRDWRDVNGRTLWRYANDLKSKDVQAVLATQLGSASSRDPHSPRVRRAVLSGQAGESNNGAAPIGYPLSPSANSEVAPPSPASPVSPSSPSRKPSGDSAETGNAPAEATQLHRTRTEAVLPSADADNDSQEMPQTLRRNKTAPGGIGRGPRITCLLDLGPEDDEVSRPSPLAYSGVSPRISPSLGSNSFEDQLKARAFRAVGQDDGVALAEVLEQTTIEVAAAWENRAGTTLLTLSEERKSAEAYSVLAKAFGMVVEMRREEYEERDTVWVFVKGEVMPKRATVLEDTPAEADTVLLEYWDGDEPAKHVERSRVRRMAS